MITGLLLALAQDSIAPGLAWTTGKQPNLSVAYIEYDVGLTLSAVCQSRSFTLALGGLPPARADASYRRLEVNLTDDTLRAGDWAVSSNGERSAALSTAPAVYARRLLKTPRLTVRVPGDDSTPARRYELDLPADPAPLAAVMTECAIPLESASDATYDPSISVITWDRPPQMGVPSPMPSVTSGNALIQCAVDARGRPQNCVLLDEQPARSGFGRYALQAVRTGRVRQIDGSPFEPGATFTTRMTFNVQG
ncbi:hypothetical protein [Brevundimonas sp.]|uniref:hypothetical protein n=1 Tax=Brevundimonas sp. TaxID=1871086 RepID=UPI0028A7DDBD|nr:hypothetical protein [Brevundimonas sp.]